MFDKYMCKKTISIIVPIYRCEAFLRRCIKSIIAQTYKNIEIILVDDGSDDHSGSICDEYSKLDERIKVVHKNNGGLSSARNVGLRESTGEYVGFVDGDDYIEPYMYEQMIYYFDSDVDFVTCNTCHEYSTVYSRCSVQENCDEEPCYMNNESGVRELLLLRKIDMSVCNKLFRKSSFNELQFLEGRSNEDMPVTWEVLKKSNKIINIGKYAYHYVHRGNSITTSNFFERRLDGYYFANEIRNEASVIYPMMLEEANILCVRLLHSHIDQLLKSDSDTQLSGIYKMLQQELLQYDELIRSTIYLEENLREEIIEDINNEYETRREQYVKRRTSSKYPIFYELMLQWIESEIQGKSIAKRLKLSGINSVAIYGMKELGELLFHELLRNGIDIKYVIDRRAEDIKIEVPVLKLDRNNPKVDAIIVTAVTQYPEIRKDICNTTGFKTINLHELIYETLIM